MGTAIISAVVVVLSAPFVAATIYHDRSLAGPMMLVAIAGVAASPAGTAQSLLLSTGRRQGVGLLQVLESVLSLTIFSAAVTFDGPSHMDLVIAIAGGQAASGGIHLLVTVGVLKRIGAPPLTRRVNDPAGVTVRSLRGEFAWNWTVVTMAGAATQLPVLLAGWRAGPGPAGSLRLGMTLGATASYVESGLAKIVYPEMAQQGSVERGQLLRWSLRFGIPLAALLGCAVPLLWLVIPAALGEGYRGTIVPSAAFLSASAVSVAVFWAVPKLYSEGRLRSLSGLQLGYTVALLSGVIAVIDRFGVSGAAAAMVVARIAYTGGVTYMSIRPIESKKPSHRPRESSEP
jgi:hypothetical protein